MAKKKYYSLHAYWSYLRRYKYRFLLVVFCFVIADALLAIVPIFIGRLVAALAETPVDRSQVYLQAGLLIFCNVGHSLVWHLSELLYLKLLVGENHRFGDVLFRSVISKPYPYFVGKFTGKISSYISELSRQYNQFINNVCYSYVDMFVRLPTIALIMFSVNTFTGLVFLGSVTTMLFVGRKTIRKSAEMEKKSTDKESDLNGYLVDVVANFVSVKAFRKEQAEGGHIADKRLGLIGYAKKSYFWAVVFWGSMSFLVRFVIWPGTILLNVWLFLEGRINLEQIATFTAALTLFSNYIWGVIWNTQILNLNLARIEEAYTYLFGKHNVVESYYRKQAMNENSPETQPQLEHSLELRDLQFAYPDSRDKPVLQDIQLSLSKNEKVGIVGHSGGGKTTLIKLLLGYYRLPADAILLDGQPIDNRRLVHLISYVPQDTLLFHRTIADNIAYGTDEKPAPEAIKQAAGRAHAHEFISQTHGGYNTLVGEKGIKLSMGQRQRIAIARAFLDNKPFLILDEATSALDSESEKLVQQALEDLWRDKTVLAIAHRLSTLRHMDRILVMDDGRIVESGTHQELIKKRGQYYRLWQHQHEGLIGD